MNNNIYGGYLYPGTPFVFDRVYSNYHKMLDDKNPALIGRFVVVEYSDFAFTQDQVIQMTGYVINYLDRDEKPGKGEYEPTNDTERTWCANYLLDYRAAKNDVQNTNINKYTPADRKMYQVFWNKDKNTIGYKEIGYLTSTLSSDIAAKIFAHTDEQVLLETNRATGIENGLEQRIKTMEVFWETADNATEVVDTLKELQDYISKHTSDANDIITNVQSNTGRLDKIQGTGDGSIQKAVDDAKDYTDTRVKTVQGGLDQANENISINAGDIVKNKSAIATAVTEVKAYADTAEADAVTTAKTYTDDQVATLNSKDSELETAISNEATARTDADNAISAKIGGSFNDTNTVAKAISDAQTNAETNAATKAQEKVDALAGTTVKANTDAIAANTKAISDMDAAYKAVVKAEEDARKAKDENLESRLASVETFFKVKDDETLDTALDTLKEIQNYLNGEGTVSGGILGRISTAEADITAHTSAIEVLNKATTWQKFTK